MVASKVLGTLSLSLVCALVTACGSSASSRQTFDGSQPADDGTADDGSGEPTTGGDLPPAAPDKPGCAQAQYSETLPSAASLSDLSYSPANAQQYLLSALDRRYPIGKFIMQGGIASPVSSQVGNCFDKFTQDKSSADAVLQQAETIVHECGHLFDLGKASGSKAAYVLRPDLSFTCDDGDTTKRGGKTFARSKIRSDAYQSKRPACAGNTAGDGCDTYANTYLDGSDSDSTFQSGDQGYNSVLEEATQYVNSLATSLAFQESFSGMKSSQRDGILTFLWYIERYLKYAHDNDATAYETLSGDACWRQATLSVWDRGWFYLEATKGIDALGLDDASIEPLVKDKALVAEIDALRKLECQ
jgi:hypothetical protein